MFSHQLSRQSELRILQPYHAEELYALVDANRDHLRRWLPWVDGTREPEDTRRFINEQLSIFAKGHGLVAGIWHEGRMAGTIGLADIDTHAGKADIGYWLGKEFEGKGLITTACRALIDHGFSTLNLNRITIHCQPENSRSRAVPERLGFRHEGTLRSAGRMGNRLVDLDVYSVLKEEWRS